ncbi:hypothetical protein CKAH01_08132 [Colletotrichum kahawae]|uniref:Uncharacterized protein n=1 Tax=Colletotrichum kahawae TaxID=34407 RepID=A0AAD9Y4A0_COLKA|nr:hypothetical protein CKAH01_08132 [Colletotrichum kahawae]
MTCPAPYQRQIFNQYERALHQKLVCPVISMPRCAVPWTQLDTVLVAHSSSPLRHPFSLSPRTELMERRRAVYYPLSCAMSPSFVPSPRIQANHRTTPASTRPAPVHQLTNDLRRSVTEEFTRCV